jgi:hypothetical protein
MNSVMQRRLFDRSGRLRRAERHFCALQMTITYAGTADHNERISRGGRDQRSSRCATGVSKRERPDRRLGARSRGGDSPLGSAHIALIGAQRDDRAGHGHHYPGDSFHYEIFPGNHELLWSAGRFRYAGAR